MKILSLEKIFFQSIRINKTFWIIFLIVCSLSAGAFSLYKAIKRVGQPFPGFFIGANLMVSVGQRASWLGVENGLMPLDKVKTINGEKVVDIEHFRTLVNSATIGQNLTYKIERGNKSKSVNVPVKRISIVDFLVSFLAPFAIGLIFIVFGAFTVLNVPDQRISYLYFILCSLIGTYCMVVYESYTSHTFFRFTQLYPLMAAVAVNLFAVYGEGNIVKRWRYNLISVIYVAALTIVILREYFLYNQNVSIALSKISSFFVGFTLLINIVLLVGTLRNATTNIFKDKIKVFLAGVVIASSAVGLWSMNFIFKRALFHLDEAILISLVFPVFMSYAILRKNIFDIDRVLRISLTYALSTGLVLTFYVSSVAVLGFIWPGFMYSGSVIGFLVLLVILAVIGALIFKPLAGKLQTVIYKLLFKAKYNRLQTLMQFGKKLSDTKDMDIISRLLVSDLTELMGLKGAVLLIYSEEMDSPTIQDFFGVLPDRIRKINLNKSNSKLIKAFQADAKPQFIRDLSNVKTAKDIDYLKSLGFKIVVPMYSKGDLLGILFLKEKSTKDIFTGEDLEFLDIVSKQAAVFLENAKLYHEKAKREKLAALGEVASVIIHEIKNPLGIIKVSSGTIKKKSNKDDHRYELATFIEQETDRMNTTITQILNFAKPIENRFKWFSLNDLIDGIVKEIKFSHQKDKRELNTVFLLKEDSIFADPDKIRRALLNLIINAVQATKQGDKIEIKTRIIKNISRWSDEEVVISVEDNGEGIDPEKIDKILKPFYTTKQEGTGLGLSIVDQIAKDHFGELNVVSRPKGGSIFSMKFPKIGQEAVKEKKEWTSLTNIEL